MEPRSRVVGGVDERLAHDHMLHAVWRTFRSRVSPMAHWLKVLGEAGRSRSPSDPRTTSAVNFSRRTRMTSSLAPGDRWVLYSENRSHMSDRGAEARSRLERRSPRSAPSRTAYGRLSPAHPRSHRRSRGAPTRATCRRSSVARPCRSPAGCAHRGREVRSAALCRRHVVGIECGGARRRRSAATDTRSGIDLRARRSGKAGHGRPSYRMDAEASSGAPYSSASIPLVPSSATQSSFDSTSCRTGRVPCASAPRRRASTTSARRRGG